MKSFSLGLAGWALVAAGCGGEKVDVTTPAHDPGLGDTTFAPYPVQDVASSGTRVPVSLSDSQCPNMTAAQFEGFARSIDPNTPNQQQMARSPMAVTSQFILSWILCNKGRIAVGPGGAFDVVVHRIVTDTMQPIGSPAGTTDTVFVTETVPIPALPACRCYVQAVGIQPLNGPNTVFQTVPNTLDAQANIQGLDFEFPIISLEVMPSDNTLIRRYEVQVPPEHGVQAASFTYATP